jgi:hypothetical protein
MSTRLNVAAMAVVIACALAMGCGAANGGALVESEDAGSLDGGIGSSAGDATDGDGGLATCSPFIIRVVSVDYGPGAGFGQTALPTVVEGPPRGGGCCQGSLNVLSLGNGGSIVVELGQNIVDGPGADFIVFENAFDIGSDPQKPNADPGTVEMSSDGVEWIGFPCAATAYPFGQCAGWHPVFANPDDNVDPLDPAVAGGDPFDLADVPAAAGIGEVRYLRITDRVDVEGDFDLDAVGVVHGRCR